MWEVVLVLEEAVLFKRNFGINKKTTRKVLSKSIDLMLLYYVRHSIYLLERLKSIILAEYSANWGGEGFPPFP